MRSYLNEKSTINTELKKITRKPEEGEYFGIFTDEICTAEIADTNVFKEQIGFNRVFTRDKIPEKALILKYIGENICEEIITGTKFTLISSYGNNDYETLTKLSIKNLNKYIENPLIIEQTNTDNNSELCSNDMALFELNKEFLLKFLNTNKEEIRDILEETQILALKELAFSIIKYGENLNNIVEMGEFSKKLIK